MNLGTLGLYVSREATPPIDPRRIAKVLQIEAKARADAQQEEPLSAPGPTEHEIDDYHTRLLHEQAQGFAGKLDAEQARQCKLQRAVEHPPFAEVAADLSHQAEALKTEFKLAASERQQALERQQADYRAFRSAAGLTRQPIEPHSYALHWAIVLAAVLVEAVANAPYFAAGSVLGLAGGVAVASCIAALNVFLAASAGVLLRYVNHVSWRVKAAAIAFGLGYGFFLLAFHLGVAHWRNALAGLILNVKPREAGQAALAALTQIPFSLLTVEAWALVIIGVTFALIALIAGYRARDPYPGYSAVVARSRAAAQALRALKDSYVVGLNALFEGGRGRRERRADERIRQLELEAEQAIGAYRASVAETEQLKRQYGHVLSQIASSYTYCIGLYRSVYRAVRQSAPAYFAQAVPPLPETAALDLIKYQPKALDEPALHAALASGTQAAMTKMREVQATYLRGASALFAELGLEQVPSAAAAGQGASTDPDTSTTAGARGRQPDVRGPTEATAQPPTKTVQPIYWRPWAMSPAAPRARPQSNSGS